MASVRCEVRSSTRVPEAPATRSATLVSATSRPRPMTTRWSAVSSSSLIRWLETRIARPSAASDRRYPRIHRMPSGSRPLTGSSKMSTGGSPSMARRDAEPLPHAERETAGPPPRGRRETHLFEHLGDPAGGDAVALRHPQQMVLGTPTGVYGARVEQRADLREGCGQRPVRSAADQCRSAVRGVEPEHDAHRRGLPGPVRADEPGDLAGAHGEREVVDGHRARRTACAGRSLRLLCSCQKR